MHNHGTDVAFKGIAGRRREEGWEVKEELGFFSLKLAGRKKEERE